MKNEKTTYTFQFLLSVLSAVCLSAVSAQGACQQPPSETQPAAAGVLHEQKDDRDYDDGWVVPAARRTDAPVRKDTLLRTFPANAATATQAPHPTEPRTRTQGGRNTRIRIDNADLISNNEDLAPGVQKLTGNVRFYHGNTLMTCDQAEFDRGRNTFFAFGNVYVNEGDTLTLRSDRMLYTGDDQLIKSYGNVELVHKTTTLRTDTLDYDRRAQQAYYFDGGVITDDKNTLESQIGVYRTADDMADFYLDVHAWDPDYNMYSDTLHYHTRTKVIYVEGPTHIYGDKNRIYTESGHYDTQSGISEFYRQNRISYGRRTLLADTLHYDRPGGYARAVSRVEIQDTVQRAAVYGDFAEYFERQDSVIFPRNPKAVQILDRDTLYTRADTMMVTRRSTLMAYLQRKRQASADTLAAIEAPDSVSSTVSSGRLRGALERLSPASDNPQPQDSLPAVLPPDGLWPDEHPQPSETQGEEPSADTLSASAPLGEQTQPFANEKQRRKAMKKRLRAEKRAAKTALPADTPGTDTMADASFLLPADTLREDTLSARLASIHQERLSAADAAGTGGGIDAPDTLSWHQDTSGDSLRVMRSFHDVRFFKKDMSGVADSLFYDQKTGITYLYGQPAVFSMQNQITADTLYLIRDLQKDVLDSIILSGTAFILSQDARDTSLYNQVRGKTMRGKIIGNDLRTVDVRGNAQTLYYSYDNDGKSIGLNKSDASTMRIIMKNSKIQRVRFNKEPSGMMLSAGKDSPPEAQQLPGYVRREDERPLNAEAIWGGPLDIDLEFAARPAEPESSGVAPQDAPEDRAGKWISESPVPAAGSGSETR